MKENVMDARLHHISTGVHASIYAYRLPLPAPNGGAEIIEQCEKGNGWRAVKIVHAGPTGQRANLRPHDILKEVEILRKVDHPNIIKLLDYSYLEDRMEHRLTLPLLAFTLQELLDRPSLDLPSTPPVEEGSGRTEKEEGQRWMEIFRSVAFQLFSSLSYLHGRGIGHRDIKPSNLMFNWNGTLQLIDFGTAWAPALSSSSAGHGDEGRVVVGELWQEEEGRMVCEVGSGPYRAPELLFSPSTYDTLAIDIWAAGCVLAEFWIPPYSPSPPSSDVDSDSGSEDDPLEDARRDGLEDGTEVQSRALFDAKYGDLGLAASIFRVRGSPTEDNWPAFKSLPDANKITFPSSHGIPLASILSDLPSSTPSAHIIDLIEGMLLLDPSRRSSSSTALQSPLFDPPLSLPVGYPLAPPRDEGSPSVEATFEPWLSAARKHYAHILGAR